MAAPVQAIEDAIRTTAFRSRSLSFYRLFHDLLELHTTPDAFILKCALSRFTGYDDGKNKAAILTTAAKTKPPWEAASLRTT
jgi:hypothetical protein